MEGNGQHVLIDVPKALEQHFRLAAGIDEKQCRLVPLDHLVEFAMRVIGRMPGPGQPLLGLENGQFRRGAADHAQQFCLPLRQGLSDPVAQEIGASNGGGKRGDAHIRRQLGQPRYSQRQKVATLAGHQGMELVQHDTAQRPEHQFRMRVGNEQRQLLGRG